MLTKEKFHALLQQGPLFLDGATGSNLQKMGMPRGCCTEKWILENPKALVQLQTQYVQAGSNIIYAPTFQAQPIALQKVGLEPQTEAINEQLVKLSRSVSGSVLVAGNLTTLATFTDSFDEENFDLLVENYRRQIKGLLYGGADLLAAETLMYPTEAEAILTAAELEGAETVIYTFTMQSDGSLFSGRDAAPVLQELENAGAAAVGFNCVAADSMTAGLVSRLKRYVKGPLVCKPNAGIPVIGEDGLPHYPMSPAEFAEIQKDCCRMGATILGGCCGTDPEFIRITKNEIKSL
ncbi:MAG: homocysteine S-methyltransferase family protein [Oscillospiraceae bacterium]|nr:homocysteine S-methyltransferase family protein [Oscillospiraceae bacterium]